MTPFPDLERLVSPRCIAIVGASQREGSQGRRLVDNILLHSSFGGDVFMVNPAANDIQGRRCWPSIMELPAGDIDVALVIVNATQVLPALRQCADRRIPFAVVMTSGFAEIGEDGRRLEDEMKALCAASGLRIYGPNCPGFVNVRDRLGMTFSPAFKDDLNPGSIGLATQGGGLGRNVLQALGHGNGVGLWFSAGNEVDLGLPDFIAHMAGDPRIQVIAVLMEGIKDGARLIQALELARERGKPVVVLKIGHSEYGVRAAQSHTASMAGSAQVNSAVFRQHGAIEVDDLDELAAVSRILARGAPRIGADTCIVTFSGGAAALAADAVGAAGLALAQLQPSTVAALSDALPAFASLSNPVDTTADILRKPELTRQCLRIVCDDEGVGTVLIPIPMDYGLITEGMGQTIVEVAQQSKKLIVPVWMSRRMGAGFQVMDRAGLHPFLSLTDAVSALRKVHRARAKAEPGDRDHSSAATVSQGSGASARVLSEIDAKHLLRKAGIAVPSGVLVRDVEAAVDHARVLGYPVVMKIVSAQIAHKTEAGGVRLGLQSDHEVRAAYAGILAAVADRRPDAIVDGVLVEKMFAAGGREVLIGVHCDQAFGPIITFGLGGIFVEVLRDVSHRALPISRDDAHEMIREIRAFNVLQGVRGHGEADLVAIEDLLLRVSDFVQHRGLRVQELDLNPVWVGNKGQGAVPLDAMLVLAADAT